jgi:hypothetical protein
MAALFEAIKYLAKMADLSRMFGQGKIRWPLHIDQLSYPINLSSIGITGKSSAFLVFTI